MRVLGEKNRDPEIRSFYRNSTHTVGLAFDVFVKIRLSLSNPLSSSLNPFGYPAMSTS